MAARNSSPNTVPWRAPGFNRDPRSRASVRMAQLYSLANGKNAMEAYRESCRRVALGNEVLRSFGLVALVTECNAPIDASLASDQVPDLATAVHECEVADCAEEMTDEALRHAIELGTLTVEQAKAARSASAMKRHKAEQKERALTRWINEQESA